VQGTGWPSVRKHRYRSWRNAKLNNCNWSPRRTSSMEVNGTELDSFTPPPRLTSSGPPNAGQCTNVLARLFRVEEALFCASFVSRFGFEGVLAGQLTKIYIWVLVNPQKIKEDIIAKKKNLLQIFVIVTYKNRKRNQLPSAILRFAPSTRIRVSILHAY